MKAIIPVAGAGTMLRPHTHTQPKALIPVAGKPILGHIVEALHTAGVEEMIFVIGYLGDKIRQYVTETFEGRFPFRFVVQEPRRGLAHALWLCQEHFAGSDAPVVIALGDTIVDVNLLEVLGTTDSVVCVQEVDTPGNFGIVVLDDKGDIRSMVEKPRIPKSNLAAVGLYKIVETRQLFEALDAVVRPNLNGTHELHLTDALQKLVESGVRIRPYRVKSWFDCGEKGSLLDTNRVLLNRNGSQVGTPGKNCVILPPVYIPESCVLENSIIGPYVALGEHAQVKGSVVQNSILGAYSHLVDMTLRDSIVGNDTTLKGRWQSINIGDNTEIDFNL